MYFELSFLARVRELVGLASNKQEQATPVDQLVNNCENQIHNSCPPLSRKRGNIKSHSSVRPSVCLSVRHKNFNLGHNFCTITDRALILGMRVLCGKIFPMVPCRDLDRDLWPTSRSNLLPSGGPQFYEFACCIYFVYTQVIFKFYLKKNVAKISKVFTVLGVMIKVTG